LNQDSQQDFQDLKCRGTTYRALMWQCRHCIAQQRPKPGTAGWAR